VELVDAESAIGWLNVRPLQGRVFFLMAFRGLAPTAIHVHPLRGWGRAGAPRREQLELLQAAEKFGGEEGHALGRRWRMEDGRWQKVCVTLALTLTLSPGERE